MSTTNRRESASLPQPFEGQRLDRRTFPALYESRPPGIRAGGVCESGHLPQASYPLPFEFDHIIAEPLRGKTQRRNIL